MHPPNVYQMHKLYDAYKILIIYYLGDTNSHNHIETVANR